MKSFDYKPKAEGWSGTIKIKVPNYKERLSIVKELNLGAIADASASEQIDLTEKLLDKVMLHVESVDLKFGKQSFSSFEDLQYCKEGSDLINEVGSVLMTGISLGKN